MAWHQGNDAGAQLAPVRKFLIHFTQGASIEGAIAAYQTNNSWPHETDDYRFGVVPRRVGHLTPDRAARSLKNKSGGVETNRDGVYQVEMVGFSERPWEVDWVRWGREVLGPKCRELLIPIRSTVHWVAYPDSYGEKAKQRLSGSTWDSYEGILGHQHCPENDHGDPGLIPIVDIINATLEGDWFDMATKEELEAIVAASEQRIIRQIVGNKPLVVAFDDVTPGDPDHWFAIGARVRTELTQADANQGVAEGTLRWWDASNPGPLRVPRATLESIPIIDGEPDAPAAVDG